MKKTILEIITPPTASTNIELDLVKLTEFLCKKLKLESGFGLGGQYGYGVDYKNEVFEMRPYYWGDCSCNQVEESFDEEHQPDCYQTLVDNELIEKGWKRKKEGYLSAPVKLTYDQIEKIEDVIRKKYCKKFKLTFPAGCAVHCTCVHDKHFDEWYENNKMGRNWHSDNCELELPNFKHLKTGLEIRWYKWIGRDTEFYPDEVSGKEWKKVFKDCIKSIK